LQINFQIKNLAMHAQHAHGTLKYSIAG